MDSYTLYLSGVPSLEKMCLEVGVKVEHFLNLDVTHIVVINSNTPSPAIQAKAELIGAKVISAAAVMRWLRDIRKNSPPRCGGKTVEDDTSSTKANSVVKPELLITDEDERYRPLYSQKCEVPIYLDYPCNGSPFFKKRYNANKIRKLNLTVKQRTIRKKCEPCGVIADNLEEHLASEMHQRYSQNENNFKEIDTLMADCGLDALLGTKRRKLE